MKKIASKLLILLLFILIAFTAQADNSLVAEYMSDGDYVSVAAEFSGKPSSVASIICIQLPKEKRNNPDVSYVLETLEATPEKVGAYTHVLTDAEGKIDCEINFSQDCTMGVYTTVVICGKESVSASFTRISTEGLQDVLVQLYEKTDSDQFYLYFKELLDDLLLPVSPEKLAVASEEQLKSVVEYMYENKTTNVDKFRSSCYEKLACILIEQAERGSVITEIKNNAETLGVETLPTETEGITKIHAENLTALQTVYFLDLMENMTFEDKADLIKKYHEAVVLAMASCPENYADIKTALSIFDDIKPDFEGDYKKLKDQSAVFKAMLNKKYTTIESLIKAFDDAVKNQKSAETPVVSGKPTSGGGGGGGSSKPIGGASGGSVGGSSSAPVVPVASVVSFTDLESVDWAKDAVNALAKAGVVQGNGNGLFNPENKVTRAEFIKMLIEALKLKIDGAEAEFDDVASDSWAYPYIASAYKLGIVNGVNKDNFAPENNITREDMAVIIYNVCNKLGIQLGENESAFADAEEISSYAVDAVNKLSAKGIILGTESGFMPKGNATRAQSAVIIYRVMEVLK